MLLLWKKCVKKNLLLWQSISKIMQSRTTDAIAYDDYKFGNIPSCEQETTKKDAITLQTYKFGNGETLTTLVRLVAPFAIGCPEARSCVLSYMEEE